jgi:hypothetical protein
MPHCRREVVIDNSLRQGKDHLTIALCTEHVGCREIATEIYSDKVSNQKVMAHERNKPRLGKKSPAESGLS